MSEDLESILRKSLDEVDREKKQITRTLVILFVAVVVGLQALAYFSLRIDLKVLIMSEFGLLFLAEVALALRTWMTVASSTTKMLKAEEAMGSRCTVSRRAPESLMFMLLLKSGKALSNVIVPNTLNTMLYVCAAEPASAVVIAARSVLGPLSASEVTGK